jgi:hypothetical protein
MHFPPPTMPSLKRKSFDDISEHMSKRQAVASPTESQPYSSSRSFGSVQPASIQPVNIQPRPSQNGYTGSPSISSPLVPTPTNSSGGTGRKRGRPSKADKEAWARQNASQSTGYTPISPAPIAPLPGPPAPPQTYSPGPNTAAPSAYPAPTANAAPATPAGSATETKGKKRGRAQAPTTSAAVSPVVPKQEHPETVSHTDPRTCSSDPTEQHHAALPERLDWRDKIREQIPAPAPLEPPVHHHHHHSAGRQHTRSPHTSLATGTHREITSSIERARKEGKPPLVNQA